jgi:glutaconyl-CoA/methylmalonyl-CoA decarboxylase subunit gamma
MKNYKFTIRGQQYEVDILAFEDNIAKIEVNGSAYEVEVHTEVKTKPMAKQKSFASAAAKPVAAVSAGKSSVKAPLPGNIFKIEVKVGDVIAKGQKLLIMEAMKMENDILAEKPGTVAAICVNEGSAVMQGDVLIELE